MKLIIDIPEEDYNECKFRKDLLSLGGEPTDLTFNMRIETLIANGISLENIKTKIEEEKKYYRETRDFGRYYGLVIALDILDNSFKSNNIITKEIKNEKL